MLTEAADLAIRVLLQGIGVHKITFWDSEWLAEILCLQRSSSALWTLCAHTEPKLLFTGKGTLVSRHTKSLNACLWRSPIQPICSEQGDTKSREGKLETCDYTRVAFWQ